MYVKIQITARQVYFSFRDSQCVANLPAKETKSNETYIRRMQTRIARLAALVTYN